MFLRGIGHEGILLLLYQEMPRIGILVSQYIEVSWLDEYIDVVNRCRLGRIECFEIFISQDDGRGYVLTGNRFSLFILQDYIVGDGNGGYERGIGDGIEGGAPTVILTVVNIHRFVVSRSKWGF